MTRLLHPDVSFVVGFCVPHNEGVIYGVITGPEFDTDNSLVDLYEVDASLKAFPSIDQALTWLQSRGVDIDTDLLKPCPGGLVYSISDDD